VILQVLLDYESAHRMANQNRWTGQLLNDIGHIVTVISNPGPAQFFSSFTVAMPTQIDCMSRETMFGEVIEKMYVPAPGTMQHSVYKEQRRRMPALERILGNHFQFHSVFLPVVALNPRQVRDFAMATGKPAKTDRIDAQVLAHFAEAVQPEVRPLPDAATQKLAILVARRRQLLEMRLAE
jgi:hypothetical protein